MIANIINIPPKSYTDPYIDTCDDLTIYCQHPYLVEESVEQTYETEE